GMDLERVFEYAMRYLIDEMRCRRAAVFLIDERERVLKMKKMVSEGEILQGEEEIILSDKNHLNLFLHGKKDFLEHETSDHEVSFALRIGSQPLGLLTVDPGLQKLSVLNREIITDFARELTHIIQNIRLFQENQDHIRMLIAASEVSSALIGELRLAQTLHLVVQTIIKNLGFDRVRLYLVDKDHAVLQGEVCGDLHGRIHDLSHETIPLRKGHHKLTDIVLGGSGDLIIDKYREIIAHVPLKVKNETIGLLVADNLLSRHKISSMEVKTLSSFVGHIGMAVQNARLFREVEQLSITDGLTKLYIYRYFKKRLSDEIYRAERFNNTITLIMLDIDLFKTFNDQYGHLVGDVVLVEVANKIRESIRKIDFPARYGGDEFIIFLPHASEDIASQVAVRIFNSIQECRIEIEDTEQLAISVSMGVAAYPTDAKNVEDLIKKADEALYYSKTHGRNRLSFYGKIT
ncbi:MAG: diguanylate cyclase, partial [Elusimicrobia bacterium]|nr:diguanylate cyclase [Elusimicrobiota bacterium]MBD3412776.1 diguanylate cyclase [Elusimicrobiota bacterium]